eukprot:TRINITY_DN20678_c0_g1_i1.p1 TRINITY_DN20678_c0_g1~~TRINITY_DN20678_c0_g1_i1.p1  ORF type:complete len:704 (+),score=112.02 TRINITY_DN20678_c0_g1_i1:145-2256(+)
MRRSSVGSEKATSKRKEADSRRHYSVIASSPSGKRHTAVAFSRQTSEDSCASLDLKRDSSVSFGPRSVLLDASVIRYIYREARGKYSKLKAVALGPQPKYLAPIAFKAVYEACKICLRKKKAEVAIVKEWEAKRDKICDEVKESRERCEQIGQEAAQRAVQTAEVQECVPESIQDSARHSPTCVPEPIRRSASHSPTWEEPIKDMVSFLQERDDLKMTDLRSTLVDTASYSAQNLNVLVELTKMADSQLEDLAALRTLLSANEENLFEKRMSSLLSDLAETHKVLANSGIELGDGYGIRKGKAAAWAETYFRAKPGEDQSVDEESAGQGGGGRGRQSDKDNHQAAAGMPAGGKMLFGKLVEGRMRALMLMKGFKGAAEGKAGLSTIASGSAKRSNLGRLVRKDAFYGDDEFCGTVQGGWESAEEEGLESKTAVRPRGLRFKHLCSRAATMTRRLKLSASHEFDGVAGKSEENAEDKSGEASSHEASVSGNNPGKNEGGMRLHGADKESTGGVCLKTADEDATGAAHEAQGTADKDGTSGGKPDCQVNLFYSWCCSAQLASRQASNKHIGVPDLPALQLHRAPLRRCYKQDLKTPWWQGDRSLEACPEVMASKPAMPAYTPPWSARASKKPVGTETMLSPLGTAPIWDPLQSESVSFGRSSMYRDETSSTPLTRNLLKGSPRCPPNRPFGSKPMAPADLNIWCR